MTPHVHDWHPAGTHYLTNPPVYHQHCGTCGRYGLSDQRDNPSEVREVEHGNERCDNEEMHR